MITASPGRVNLVLGIIENYTFDQLRPFLVSLKRTGYSGDIVFFHQSVDEPSLQAMRQLGVTLVPFSSLRCRWGGGFRRHKIDLLSHFYHRVKWPLYNKGWKFLLAANKLRYLLALRYLEEHGEKYRYVLFADTRDILFQSDPFESLPAEDLLFFEEDHPLGHGELNPKWIKAQLGQETFERLAEKAPLCSGTTMGTPAAMGHYLKQMVRLMKKAAAQCELRGDQGLHNAVVYEELQDTSYSIRLCGNGVAQVYTLTQYLETEQIRRGLEGEVIDSAGRPVPIVHQYDRHPHIMETLLRKFAS